MELTSPTPQIAPQEKGSSQREPKLAPQEPYGRLLWQTLGIGKCALRASCIEGIDAVVKHVHHEPPSPCFVREVGTVGSQRHWRILFLAADAQNAAVLADINELRDHIVPCIDLGA